MRENLYLNNEHILGEIAISKSILDQSDICGELEALKQWNYAFLENLEKRIRHNLHLLKLNSTDTFPNIFNNTQIITNHLRFCNERLIPPIDRYKVQDRLCLKLLSWLHQQHSEISDKPFGVLNDGFKVFPVKDLPLIYFLPSSSQRTLLHLPLFFHEVGHYIYVLHKPEMDALVKELQEELRELLLIPFYHNDKKHKEKEKKANFVIQSWYNWIQEIYCDWVGLSIGGASFLNAFSIYLRMSGRSAFFIEEERLQGSSHPVAWLRVKLLVEHAKELNLNTEAEKLASDWKLMANSLSIKENYYAFYQDAYYEKIYSTLKDMLIEGETIDFRNYGGNINSYEPEKHNFIQLLNFAWSKYLDKPKTYLNWEKAIINDLIQNN